MELSHGCSVLTCCFHWAPCLLRLSTPSTAGAPPSVFLRIPSRECPTTHARARHAPVPMWARAKEFRCARAFPCARARTRLRHVDTPGRRAFRHARTPAQRAFRHARTPAQRAFRHARTPAQRAFRRCASSATLFSRTAGQLTLEIAAAETAAPHMASTNDS